MKDGYCLYYICIVPPDNISAEVVAMQMHMADEYQSKSALRSPPHITLHMPFRWKPEKEDRIIQTLQDFCSEHEPASVHLNGFGAFPPRVIYISVKMEEKLIQMQKELAKHCRINLQLFNATYQDRPFHPHMTLAFRDLKPDAFQEAYAYWKQKPFEKKWEAGHVCLMKNLDKRWHILKVFELGK